MHAYIAGPMFNDAENWFLTEIDARVRKAGLTSFLNSRDGIPLNAPDDVLSIFKEDCHEVSRADVIVASLNGLAVDSGTAWELGWAYSQGKQIVGVFTDLRLHYKYQTVNLMIQCSLDKIVRSLDELESYLEMLVREASGGANVGGQEGAGAAAVAGTDAPAAADAGTAAGAGSAAGTDS